MRPYHASRLLGCAALLGLLLAAEARADRPPGFWGRPCWRTSGPWANAPVSLRLQPYGAYSGADYVLAVDGHCGQRVGVPTYNWGYFGARYRPTCVRHTGYYGQYVQWSWRRGY